MSAAFVIEARGHEAGLIVRIAERRFRFFAAIPAAFSLEGVEFASPVDARRAAERVMSPDASRRRR